MRLTILRHGQTQGNLEHRYVGVTDEPLCETGRQTAAAAGQCLWLTTVFVSPLLRARETARIMFPHAQQVCIDELAEMDFGVFENRAFSGDLENDEAYARWTAGNCEAPCPQGECKDDFTARTVKGIREAVKQAAQRGLTHAVIVAHGGTVMAGMSAFAHSSCSYFDWHVDNCCGYTAAVVQGEGLALEEAEFVSNLAFMNARPAPKVSVNFTTSTDDTDRYQTSAELEETIEGFDGLELMHFDPDVKGLIPKGRVTGVHMYCPTNWVDLWNEDEEALMREYGSLEVVEQVFGGTTKQALVEHFRKDLAVARQYNGSYLVFHCCDVWLEESIRFCNYHLTDEQVIQATCELMDAVMEGQGCDLALLLENLWGPGLRLTDPEVTRNLMEGLRYPNKGIMFDTGHLLHTNFDLQTQDEAVDYIHEMLDAHGDLCRYIRGMHLQQSLTGAYCKELIAHPKQLPTDYWERWGAMFSEAFKIDLHKPFTTPRVCEIVDRLPLEFLTFEFITNNKEQHKAFLDQQWAALQNSVTLRGKGVRR